MPPKPVKNLPGTVTHIGDDYGVILQDYTLEQRPGDGETNATQPHRPIGADGRVSPQGKITISQDKLKAANYWQMFVDWCGLRNAEALTTPKNGYFDTGAFMCSPSGGDLQHILSAFQQKGLWYECETFNLADRPTRTIGTDGKPVWYYQGRPVSYALTPHLIATRTNRRGIGNQPRRWITSGGVNNVSWAQAGREHWPLVANARAAQPAYKVRLYPSLPCRLVVYPRSLVVEGRLIDRTGEGVEMTVDALKFRGANTFVRNADTGLWYAADRMLIRAPEPYAASAYDYRCFVAFPDNPLTPWMEKSGYRSPEPRWQRK